MALARPSDFRVGGFFKPAEHVNDLALIVEPKSIKHDVPNEYKGNKSTRHEVVADITVFANNAQLGGTGKPTVLKDHVIAGNGLSRSLEPLIADRGALGGVVAKVDAKKGSVWVFQDLNAETVEKIEAYLEARDAQREAAAESMPSFDD